MAMQQSQKEAMYSLVEQYKCRNGSQKEFLEEHNLTASQFPYWIMKYNRENISNKEQNGFVRLTSPSQNFATGVTATFPNGISVSGSGDDFVVTVSNLYRQTL